MYDFGTKYRIKSKSEIGSLLKSGKFLRFKEFNALVQPGEEDSSRVAISVSKRLGNAVVRNKVKRCLREQFRQSEMKDKGFRILFMFKKKKIDLEQWTEFKSNLSCDFKRLEDRLI